MTMPGPGDPQTWPSSTSHPHDPRNADPEDCPACGGPMPDLGMCHGCGWTPPEPDYEEMAQPGWTR